ncbi:hypothetical protein L1987_48250 [Smallanthus sonchifolius]|uniref:Uncharacterized protein n=1 Tax=Smallanthus sonchifolius TaxID=185202 RepID=A0ACB9FSC1_9ASTR|nr:hypothetical protein L1987_48250 [Smallanthus sonchifolius]
MSCSSFLTTVSVSSHSYSSVLYDDLCQTHLYAFTHLLTLILLVVLLVGCALVLPCYVVKNCMMKKAMAKQATNPLIDEYKRYDVEDEGYMVRSVEKASSSGQASSAKKAKIKESYGCVHPS